MELIINNKDVESVKVKIQICRFVKSDRDAESVIYKFQICLKIMETRSQ